MNLKYILLITLLYFCSLNVVFSDNKNIWAVLVAGYDKYRFTYAFEAAVYKMHKLMRKRGVLPEQMITITPDAAAFNMLNPVPGFVGFAHTYEEFSENNNQYEDVIIDYNSDDLTTKLFFEILKGNDTAVKNIGTGKVLKSGPHDTVYVYWITLGVYGLITLNNRQFVWAEQLTPFLEELRENNRFRKMIFTLESEYAGSMFDDYLDPNKNILVHTFGGRFNELYLCHKNQILNVYTSTCGTYIHSIATDTVLKSGRERSKNIFDLFSTIQSIDTSPMEGHNLYGHLSSGTEKLIDIIGKPPRANSEFEFQLKSNDANPDVMLSNADMDTLKNQTKNKRTLSQLLLEDDTVSFEEKLHLENIITKIISDSIAGTNFSPKVADEKIVESLTVSENKCYKDSFNNVLATCFNDKNNHLFLVKAHKLAKLCNLDIPSDKIIAATKQICT